MKLHVITVATTKNMMRKHFVRWRLVIMPTVMKIMLMAVMLMLMMTMTTQHSGNDDVGEGNVDGEDTTRTRDQAKRQVLAALYLHRKKTANLVNHLCECMYTFMYVFAPAYLCTCVPVYRWMCMYVTYM